VLAARPGDLPHRDRQLTMPIFKLYPGQIAGLDSEEGRSLNVTCEANATTLIVDADGRDRLVEQQMATLKRPAADSQGLATLP
jgi:hypothetical protein